LSDDTVAPPGGVDAGGPSIDGSVPVFDANGFVDGQPGQVDATADVAIDSSPPADAGVDAPPPTDSGVTGTATLAAGGSVGHSAQHTLIGNVGPATAPVLRSSKYQLVGGMAAATPGP
jgi:hypothetical protein